MISKLGRFDIKELIGRGAMGEVYLGVDPVLGREVAIKTITSSALPEDQARLRFDREAKAAAILNHPNIVTIHELGEDQGMLFIAMERLKGMDLEQCMLQKTLTLPEYLEVLAQVCDGLDAAHRNHIIHRDIKPSNVMVMREGRRLLVKIMDFGVARLKDSAMTVVGTVMGTVNYIAPEYIKSGEPDARSDLFAVGVMLYECISGKKPFDGGTASTVLFKIVNDPPDPIDLSMLRGLNPALRNMTERALSKDPDDRLQTAEEFALALRAAKDPAWNGKIEDTTVRMRIHPELAPSEPELPSITELPEPAKGIAPPTVTAAPTPPPPAEHALKTVSMPIPKLASINRSTRPVEAAPRPASAKTVVMSIPEATPAPRPAPAVPAAALPAPTAVESKAITEEVSVPADLRQPPADATVTLAPMLEEKPAVPLDPAPSARIEAPQAAESQAITEEIPVPAELRQPAEPTVTLAVSMVPEEKASTPATFEEPETPCLLESKAVTDEIPVPAELRQPVDPTVMLSMPMVPAAKALPHETCKEPEVPCLLESKAKTEGIPVPSALRHSVDTTVVLAVPIDARDEDALTPSPLGSEESQSLSESKAATAGIPVPAELRRSVEPTVALEPHFVVPEDMAPAAEPPDTPAVVEDRTSPEEVSTPSLPQPVVAEPTVAIAVPPYPLPEKSAPGAVAPPSRRVALSAGSLPPDVADITQSAFIPPLPAAGRMAQQNVVDTFSEPEPSREATIKAALPLLPEPPVAPPPTQQEAVVAKIPPVIPAREERLADKPQPRRSSKGLLLVGVGLLALAALGGAGYYFLKLRKAEPAAPPSPAAEVPVVQPPPPVEPPPAPEPPPPPMIETPAVPPPAPAPRATKPKPKSATKPKTPPPVKAPEVVPPPPPVQEPPPPPPPVVEPPPPAPPKKTGPPRRESGSNK